MTDLGSFPRVELALLPTPLQELPRLSQHLGGPRVLVKRDDLTGLGMGGNKIRKLEFEIGAAVRDGADCLVSIGVIQSNALRQTAAAAAKVGLDLFAAVVTDRVARDDPEYRSGGNYLLTGLFSAHLESCSIHDDRTETTGRIVDRLRSEGRRPHLISYGVSSAVGALGYVLAAHELADQLAAAGVEADAVVHASGSAGTQAGLAVGMASTLSGTELIGVDVDAEPARVAADVEGLIGQITELLAIPSGVVAPVRVEAGYAGRAYGSVPDATMEAIRLFAELEGLVLDPVYSGKGAAGMIGLIRSGGVGSTDTVVFIHTGGYPGVFAYRSQIADALDAPEA